MQTTESIILSKTPILKVEHYESIGSTNDRAKELILQDRESLPALVFAESQTAGRGRGAKKWWTGSGAIAMSLALDLTSFGKERSILPVLSPIIAEQVRNTISWWLSENGCGSSGNDDNAGSTGSTGNTGDAVRDVEVHFPNDVYIDKKKVCGILIESPVPDCAVIGIGVNTNNTLVHIPEEFKAVPITTLFDETGLSVDNTEFMVELLIRLFGAIRKV